MTYVHEPFKRIPYIAAERKRLAAVVRDEHRKDPARTRELWFAMRRAYQKQFAKVVGGIQELLR